MFGEMIGTWITKALENYKQEELGQVKTNKQSPSMVPGDLESINLVEVGPGTGQMMCDILRTLKQFTGNLKNVKVNFIDSSPNLTKTQQEKLLKYIQEDLQIFLSYQVPKKQQGKENQDD